MAEYSYLKLHWSFGVYDLHLTENKEGYLGLNDWDITAMKHFDLGIEPHHTDSDIVILRLEKGTKRVDVELTFTYHYWEGGSAVIKKVTKEVELK